jgi:hypothetical protein
MKHLQQTYEISETPETLACNMRFFTLLLCDTAQAADGQAESCAIVAPSGGE